MHEPAFRVIENINLNLLRALKTVDWKHDKHVQQHGFGYKVSGSIGLGGDSNQQASSDLYW